MVIINYLVCGHEPKITFKEGFIELDSDRSDVISVTRSYDNDHCETEIKKEFTGMITVLLDPDNCYQLNLTKR